MTVVRWVSHTPEKAPFLEASDLDFGFGSNEYFEEGAGFGGFHAAANAQSKSQVKCCSLQDQSLYNLKNILDMNPTQYTVPILELIETRLYPRTVRETRGGFDEASPGLIANLTYR